MLLAQCDKINKYNHDKHCQKQGKHFSPFIISVDGMLGREYLVVLTNTSQLISLRMDEPIQKCKVGLMVGSKLRLGVHTYALPVRQTDAITDVKLRHVDVDTYIF